LRLEFSDVVYPYKLSYFRDKAREIKKFVAMSKRFLHWRADHHYGDDKKLNYIVENLAIHAENPIMPVPVKDYIADYITKFTLRYEELNETTEVFWL